MSEWKNGLPPVGEVCEAKFFDPKADEVSGWHEVEILKVREHGEAACLILGDTHKGRNLYWSSNLRPLKPEADRKRDELKQAAYRDADLVWQATGQGVLDVVDKLIDSGYRKVNELTDEQITSFTGECFQTSSTRIAWMNGAKWGRSQIMGEES